MSVSNKGFLGSTALSAVLAFGIGLAPMSLQAQDYRFTNVRVEGNQRIQSSTIVAYTGLGRGETVSAGALNDAYRGVFDSGLFEAVELVPRGNTLVIKVVEYPTISRINFEGNKRLKDDALSEVIESSPRRVFSADQAERDAGAIADLYRAQGRLASRVTPRIIRRNDNRVDLVFEISEGDTVEVERVSLVGNRAFSDRRLRRVLETKQATFLRALINRDTLIEDRIQFDRQVLTDFYRSRGYVDFQVNSVNAEVTKERDAAFLVVDVTEGQKFEFGDITVTSEFANADPDVYRSQLRLKRGVTYSPLVIENAIETLEQLAVRQGIDFLRVEPRVTRNDRDLTLDVEFAMVRGPRIFVERIDIEGNTTTLDRVIRRQFKIVEGDPLNQREIRNSAERIRALGFFAQSEVDVRQGSTPNDVIVDVDVEEQPTGSFTLGGSYSVDDGIGVAIGISENNFLGRGQQLSFNISTAQDTEEYKLRFVEPKLLGRDLQFAIDLGLSETESSYSEYDTSSVIFRPSITFDASDTTSLQLRYALDLDEMKSRGLDSNGNDRAGPVLRADIAEGKRTTSSIGATFTYDSRRTGLNPTAGFLIESGLDYAGLGGDNEYIRATSKIVAQKLVFNEEITLRATVETGYLGWLGDNKSRTIDRFLLSSDTLRGFEPGGIGPRDMSGSYDDALGGNLYAVARFDAEFPLGLPEELGIRGGLFYDVGNLWGLDDSNAAAGSNVVGRGGSFRHVVGFSLLWTTGLGPLRFNFSKALSKEEFDKERNFDLTIQARF
ncbi:outer membrane protein assembly factor BamA [Tritonibacter scottomollicae]|uniref:Outer membrane protein assembly factor BamA n=1 Tax=Tritonibacter scottomollicae TaxID=483013 RepID=A0ABZ0HKP0_TRISK|nr:outer membrane protein assembly factor BamA [Tritonibacter scottomollicae]WOI34082.1 outer membrane protein assembly factor BamA [Tritonibacter scottomollicae]